MKRKLFILALAAICTSIIAAGTLAYYTAEDTANNVITSGGIDIDVVEQMRDGDGNLVDFPDTGITGVMPDTSVSKIVTVKNTGTSDAWIRINVEMLIKDANGELMAVKLPSGEQILMINFDNENWTDGRDGYYYYNSPLASGESTTPLFEEVKINPLTGNDYQKSTANINIYAQAVQTANNGIPAGGSVTDIKGWPAADGTLGG